MEEIKTSNENNKNSNSNNNINKNENEKLKLTGYPDKFTKIYEENKNATIFSWDLNTIRENDYQKISIEMPIFNKKCRKLVKNIFINKIKYNYFYDFCLFIYFIYIV
jgi:hypothetical protein